MSARRAATLLLLLLALALCAAAVWRGLAPAPPRAGRVGSVAAGSAPPSGPGSLARPAPPADGSGAGEAAAPPWPARRATVSATPDAPALRELLATRSGAPVSVAVAASPEGFGYLLSSEILDGRLTARGLEVSDPGLSRAIGLRPGDLVVSVNEGPIATSPIALARIARDPDALLIIQIERQGRRLALTVRAR